MLFGLVGVCILCVFSSCRWNVCWMQCLRLTEEELAEREVDVVDIAFDELAEKHYKEEEVRLCWFICTVSVMVLFIRFLLFCSLVVSCCCVSFMFFTTKLRDLPSVLWHCSLGVRNSIRPAKMSDEVLTWLSVSSEVQMIMAALHSRCGHYIFALWFLLLSSFFLWSLISAVTEWMSTILLRMVWLKCEFIMRV